MKFGIIGAGMIGRFHAKAIQEMTGGELHSVFDLRAEGAEKLAGEFGAKAYSDITSFLADPELEIVTIGTPHHGTWLGRFSRVSNGKQMRQEGPWLTALREREARRWPQGTYARFTCWYSNADNIVFPTSTATLPGADNRLVQGHAHVAMAFEQEIVDGTLALPVFAA